MLDDITSEKEVHIENTADEVQTSQENLKLELLETYTKKIARYANFTQVIEDETAHADTLVKACKVYIDTLGAGPSIRMETPDNELMSISFKTNASDHSILFAKLNTDIEILKKRLPDEYSLVKSESGVQIQVKGVNIADVDCDEAKNELFLENFSAPNQTVIQFIHLVENIQEEPLFTEKNITTAINKQTSENAAIAVIEKVGKFLTREKIQNKIKLEIEKAVETIYNNIADSNEQREAIELLKHTLGDSPIEIVDSQAAELIDTMQVDELEQQILEIYDTIIFSNATAPAQLEATVNNEPYSVLYGALISKKTGERYEWGKKRPIFVHFNEALALRVEYTYGDRGEPIGRHEFADGTLIKMLSLVDARMVHAFREVFEIEKHMSYTYLPGTPEAGAMKGNGVYVEGVLHPSKGYTKQPRNMHVSSKDIKAVIFRDDTLDLQLQKDLLTQNPDMKIVPYSQLNDYYK